MNEIDIISTIKRENLDELNYFISLIKNAHYYKMLTDDDILNLQIQMLELLDERIYRYNGSYSSSIRKEIIEDISNSNIYTIGIYLKTFRNPDEAVNAIKEKGLKVIYQEGRKKIDTMLNIIRVMYIKVKQNKLNIQNDTYNDTLEVIQRFIDIYDPDFKAQDIKITVDYPLYNNLIGKLEGVEFVKEYLNSIYLENSFCRNFSEEKIKYLLYGYSHDFQELIINIFEIVLLETMACKLVKRNIQDLSISIYELNEIYELFKNKEKIDIKNTIIRVYQDILSEIKLNTQEYRKYIEKNLDNIIEMIVNSIKQKTLDKLFIPQRFIEL